jgi:cytochrome c biogenesis factor
VILSDVRYIRGAVNNRPDAQTATFTFIVNPLVNWIWFGGMIIALGGLIGLWPAVGATKRAPAVVMRRPSAVPAEAAGD